MRAVKATPYIAACAFAVQHADDAHAREASGGSASGAARQLCASALVRLVADLWLSAGPCAAFPLALLLLRRRAPASLDCSYAISIPEVLEVLAAVRVVFLFLPDTWRQGVLLVSALTLDGVFIFPSMLL